MNWELIAKMRLTKTYQQIIDELNLDITRKNLASRMYTYRRGGVSKTPETSSMTKWWMAEHQHMTMREVMLKYGHSVKAIRQAEYRTGIKLRGAEMTDIETNPADYPVYARIPELRPIICGAWV